MGFKQLFCELMRDRVVQIIKWCVFLLLTAKGILHFTTSQPYEFLFGETNLIEKLFGIVLILFGLIALLPHGLWKKTKWIYLFTIPSLILIVQSAASYIKAGSVIEQIVEHSLQMMLPLVFMFIMSANNYRERRLFNLLAVLVGLTFVGHALYAIGLHYVPENFIEMTMKSLHLTKNQALKFLFIIGWLDIVFALLAFIPFVRKYTIWYLIIWGFLTSIARTYYVLGDEFSSDLLFINLPNTIYRLPHGVVPVLMLILAKKIDVRKTIS